MFYLTPHQLTLGLIIAYLEIEVENDPDRILPIGFGNPHSYRGDYYQLAFEPRRNATVGDMLTEARSALNTTYEGWKGGDYTMTDSTYCWLAHKGSVGESIGHIFFHLLLGRELD